MEIIKNLRPQIHGMIHCSGGAQTKVMNFVKGIHVVKDNLFGCPPLFRIIQEQSGTPWQQMYQVFNMGHRFEIYTDETTALKIMDISARFGLDARIVGYCEKRSTNRLTLRSEFGEFIY
jgi:phosphoribosylformylglycinamidine cyclo-ligase